MTSPMRLTWNFLQRRKRAYQLTFKHNMNGQEVLNDLAKFCRADRPTWSDDARHHARLEGRREVWLRIANHLGLTVDQLYAIYTGGNFNPLIADKEEENDV